MPSSVRSRTAQPAGRFSVTAGGTQTIVLDPQDDATGSVTLTLAQNGAMLAFAPAASSRRPR